MGRAEAILRNSWFLGGLVAVASWNVVFRAPGPGNDGSWVTGLYLAAHQGLHFGDQLIFTYGPLGFLSPLSPSFGGVAVVAEDGLAQLAFLYSGAIHLLVCVSLVWALRRGLHPALAAVLAFALIAGFTAIERPYVLAAVWCLALLSEEPPDFARRLVIFGGGGLAAIESLIRLSSGPAILAMCVITLAAREGWRRDLAALAGTYIAALAALWFAAGQSLSNIPDFVAGAFQIVTGYSAAMASAHSGTKWDLAVVAGVLAVAALAAVGFASAAPRRQRLAASLVLFVAAFAAFKEGMVREDEPHLSILFATALALSLAVPWRRAWTLAAVAIALALGALAFETATPAISRSQFNPYEGADSLVSGLRTLTSGARRDRLAESGRELIVGFAGLDPATQRLVAGHPVHIDPSGASIVWAFGLDWRPLPVFQENSAYTSALDQDNVDFLRSPDGPELILRGNLAATDPFASGTIDGRNPIWNPPAVSIAFLCDLRPLRTTSRWQVLGRGRDRCGEERLLDSVETRYGERVEVPRGGPGEAVIARIHGAGVSGLERLRTALFRARFRFVELNGGAQTYRLVPGTAGDGLIMSVPPSLDLPAPFGLSPGARTLELTGPSGELRIDFYALPLERVSIPKGSIRSAPVSSSSR